MDNLSLRIYLHILRTYIPIVLDEKKCPTNGRFALWVTMLHIFLRALQPFTYGLVKVEIFASTTCRKVGRLVKASDVKD